MIIHTGGRTITWFLNGIEVLKMNINSASDKGCDKCKHKFYLGTNKQGAAIYGCKNRTGKCPERKNK